MKLKDNKNRMKKVIDCWTNHLVKLNFTSLAEAIKESLTIPFNYIGIKH